MYYVHKFLIILNAINSNLFKYLCFYLAFEEVHAVMLNIFSILQMRVPIICRGVYNACK